LDNKGVVVDFHEKPEDPPSNLANAAVYLLEQEVVEWITNNPTISDFSTEVVPQFLGKIATWENKGTHRDIGTISSLREAQNDVCDFSIQFKDNLWQQHFLENKVHQLINNGS
jgi:mannose-1-phosphate guanylyltransferase